MKLIGLLLIGFGLGADRPLMAFAGVVVFMCERQLRTMSSDSRRSIPIIQFQPSAETPKQPGAGSMPEVSIAPWPGAYEVC